MKRLLAAVVAVVVIAGNAYAVAPGGMKSSGLLPANAHSHVTTVPIRLYGIVVTPTAANGFAQLLETKGARVDSGLLGTEYVSKDKVLVDVKGAVANQTLALSLPGVDASRVFVDTQNATCEFYYRE